MKMCKAWIVVALAGAALSAFPSGFGLYEASAKAHAMNGAVVGRATDASANFFNPATLTDLDRPTVTFGFVTEHPRGRVRVDGARSKKMDPGMFVLPHVQTAVPLPWGFAAGLGVMPEYGLGSAYTHDWELRANSRDTTVMSATVNPNLAWKATDRWSVGGGLRFLFFDFEQHADTMRDLGIDHRLKGDNDMKNFGWQLGTKYDLLDNLSLGLVWKSETYVRVKGKSQVDGHGKFRGVPGYDALYQQFAAIDGPAKTTLVLPQSITAGFNWDVTETWHLGFAAMWTQWSSVDTLHFHLNGQTKDIKLNWKDTWRFAVAPSWDFADDWTAILSYAYETDCCGRQDSTMLPPSERHMISSGLVWRATENLELALSYGLILLDGHTSDCTTADGVRHRYKAHGALCHSAGFTVTYRF